MNQESKKVLQEIFDFFCVNFHSSYKLHGNELVVRIILLELKVLASVDSITVLCLLGERMIGLPMELE